MDLNKEISVDNIKSYIQYYEKNNGRYDSTVASKKPIIKNVFKKFRNQIWEILKKENLQDVFGAREKTDLKAQYAGGGVADKYPDWLWVYPSEDLERYGGEILPIILISAKQYDSVVNQGKITCFAGLGYKFKGEGTPYYQKALRTLLDYANSLSAFKFYESSPNENKKGEVWTQVEDDSRIEQKIERSARSWPHFSLGQQKELSLNSTDEFLNDLSNLVKTICLDLSKITGDVKKTQESAKKLQTIPLELVADQFIEYVDASGFHFEDEEIKNFILSLKTKPFVILAGISGTGKTKLAILFAKFVGQKPKIISVKPNWTDNTDLLGYEDLQGTFQTQPLTEILLEANKPENSDKPFFVILDEMNLARVEHYFSDFLSKMETRDSDSGRILSEPIFDKKKVGQGSNGLGDLRITDNVYVIGTVNMDETTHPFSRKVLDRANSLEFNDVKLDELGNREEKPKHISLSNEVIKAEYLRLSDVYEENPEFFDRIIEQLQNINEILRRGDFQFGYRVRDELSIYLWYAIDENLLDEQTAFDFQFKQKILPRLQGSTQTIQYILQDLHKLTLKNTSDQLEDWRHNENIKSRLKDFDNYYDQYKYPRSGKKILRMQRRYLEQTFTSFWI